MKYIKGGFTLVEMLITIGILSFLLIIFSQVIGGIFALQLKSGVTSTLSQDYHFLLSRLSYDVARASTFAVTSPTALDLTINSFPAFASEFNEAAIAAILLLVESDGTEPHEATFNPKLVSSSDDSL